ncbi:protein O-mannosyl-transferase TMTC2-like [Sitophilus oryzae]|uniref:dolichyl-phosphate-mannose--protein mannosyltransferase n=1 Tax=Sitophilus oryzae TaxID=7048 RepID=A0A6J2X3P6_SITOR|nr:protein O-mannosyl-transferase TMTC2-like [Sitophilus oryzae]
MTLGAVSADSNKSARMRKCPKAFKMDYGSLLCCTAAFVLYCNTLTSEFVYDDRRAILTNPDLLPKTPWSQLWENDFWGTPLSDSGSHGSYRPLSVLTFRLNYLFGEFNPWGYHFVNILLHCSATFLLIRVARKLLPKSRKDMGSLITGALFAAHPIHTEAVAGIVGRADLAACNLFFLSLLAYMSHVANRDSVCCSKIPTNNVTHHKHGSKRYDKFAVTLQKSVTSCNWPNKNLLHHEPGANSGSKRAKEGSARWCCWKLFLKEWFYVILSVVLAVCAMLSKETGITVLGISFVYDFVYAKAQNKKQHRSLVVLFVSLVFILIARLQTRAPHFSTADNPTAKDQSFFNRAFTFSYLTVFNFWLLIFPDELSFDWGMEAIPRVKSVRDPRVLCTGVFYCILTCIVCKCVMSVQKLKEDDNAKKQKRFSANTGCFVCCRKTSDSHSRICRSNNNNNNAILTCTCNNSATHRKATPSGVILFSIALMTIPFLPATNLFFYVGFVVAERVLYVPSAGFCLLIGFVCAEMLKRRRFRVMFSAGLVLVLLAFGGKTIWRNGDWADEEALYRSAIPFNPAKAYGNLGSILSTKGRTLEAEEAFRKALDFRPNMADVHYNLGILLQGRNELDEAIQSYQKAIHFRPSLALAYVNMGTALIAAGRCQEAITILRQGSKLDGTGLRDRREHESARISALLQLGALYSDQGRLPRAVAAYKEAVHILPSYYPPQKLFNILGETLAKMQQDEEAEKWYRAALAAEPNHVAAHITYGKLLAKNVSRSAEAEQWFRRAQRLAPEDASVYHHYGAFLALSRRFKEAAILYEKAAELRYDDYELAVAAATAMRKAGRQEDAEKWYRRALSMKPSDPRGHTNLGAMLHLNGKYKEAEHCYKEALRIQPDDFTTITNLQKLHGLMT